VEFEYAVGYLGNMLPLASLLLVCFTKRQELPLDALFFAVPGFLAPKVPRTPPLLTADFFSR